HFYHEEFHGYIGARLAEYDVDCPLRRIDLEPIADRQHSEQLHQADRDLGLGRQRYRCRRQRLRDAGLFPLQRDFLGDASELQWRSAVRIRPHVGYLYVRHFCSLSESVTALPELWSDALQRSDVGHFLFRQLFLLQSEPVWRMGQIE